MGKEIEFDYMLEDKVMTSIRFNPITGVVHFRNLTSEPVCKAFGNRKSVSEDDVNDLLESRCFEEGRADCDKLLRDLDIEFYNPLLIVRKTHGVMIHDDFWIRFAGENITYEEARWFAELGTGHF